MSDRTNCLKRPRASTTRLNAAKMAKSGERRRKMAPAAELGPLFRSSFCQNRRWCAFLHHCIQDLRSRIFITSSAQVQLPELGFLNSCSASHEVSCTSRRKRPTSPHQATGLAMSRQHRPFTWSGAQPGSSFSNPASPTLESSTFGCKY